MSETNPGRRDADPMGRALHAAIVESYERHFAEAPARAAAARQRSGEAIGKLAAGLQQFDFPVDELRAGLDTQDAELRRVLSWGAFDYSVETEKGTIAVVAAETLILPAVNGLHIANGDFPAMVEYTEDTIIGMHLFRHGAKLGPVVEPDMEFFSDFMTVNGPLDVDIT